MLFIGFPILSYPIRPRATKVLDVSNHVSSQTKYIIKLYTDHNILWVTQTTHDKAESLRSFSLSKLGNTVNNNSIFNTKSARFSAKC